MNQKTFMGASIRRQNLIYLVSIGLGPLLHLLKFAQELLHDCRILFRQSP
jgi:hypothetical protein